MERNQLFEWADRLKALRDRKDCLLYTSNGMAIFDGNTAATFTGTGETTLSLNVAEGLSLIHI